jgi:F-box protein GID2
MAGEDEESRVLVAAGKYKKLALCQDEVASNVDMLNEIFKHLDAASLAMASCVSKKWKQATDDEGLWEAICTRHWPSTASSQSGQLKSVVVGLGGFRRLYGNYLHPILSGNNSKHKHLKSCSISKRSWSSSYSKKKWSKDEVYLSLSLFSIDRYWRIPPLVPNSARMAGIVCKPCSYEQQPASSSSTAFTSDVHRLLDGWRGNCSFHPSNANNKSSPHHSARKIGINAEDAKYCWGSMDSQSSSK